MKREILVSSECKKALDASIRKYRRTVEKLKCSVGKRIILNEGKYYIEGTKKMISYRKQDCPLCCLYYEDGCEGCCIKYDTQDIYCHGTPYYNYTKTLVRSNEINKDLIDPTEAELHYLIGLSKRVRVTTTDMEGK
jgi:hypothetical protein